MTTAERAAEAEVAKIKGKLIKERERGAKSASKRSQHHRQQHKSSSDDDDNAASAVPRAAFTIPEFCRAHRISESFFYKMRNAGFGPREARVMGKVLITAEAAREWRHEREQAGVRAQS